MYKVVKKDLVDSISIPILHLGRGVVVSHKVKLSKPDKFGNRDYFHKEFTYRSKYPDTDGASTLRLTHSSILVVENKNADEYDSLIINMVNRDFVVKSLNAFKKILKDPDLFIEDNDGRFIVNPKLRKDSTISFSPYRNSVVIIKPCVIEREDEEPTAGVSMILNTRNMETIEIPAELFKVFIKIIKKFDFHVSGIAAVTYLQSAEIGNREISVGRSNALEFGEDLAPEYNVKKKNNINLPGEVSKPKNTINKGW